MRRRSREAINKRVETISAKQSARIRALESEIAACRRRIRALQSYPTIVNTAIVVLNQYLSQGVQWSVLQEQVILIGAVDNNRSRQLCHQAFYACRDLIYIDSGNSEFTGQVVCGVRRNGHTLSKPIGGVHPELLKAADLFPSERSCAEAALADPQSMAANLTAATAVLDILYNILTHGENYVRQTDFSTKSVKLQSVLDKRRVPPVRSRKRAA